MSKHRVNNRFEFYITLHIILDKILKTFDITAEELFATNQLKDSAELLQMINKNIAKLENMPEKLEIIYNLTQSLSRK